MAKKQTAPKRLLPRTTLDQVMNTVWYTGKPKTIAQMNASIGQEIKRRHAAAKIAPAETTRLSSKGQVVLPLKIRDARGWKPGTKFTVEETGDGILLRPARSFPPSTLDEIVGFLKYKGKPKTLAQMDDAITQMVKERHDRGRY